MRKPGVQEHEGEWGLLPSPDTFCPPVPAQEQDKATHAYWSYRTAAKCPDSREKEGCLAVEGSGRAGFSSLGDSPRAIFISKPTLKLLLSQVK